MPQSAPEVSLLGLAIIAPIRVWQRVPLTSSFRAFGSEPRENLGWFPTIGLPECYQSAPEVSVLGLAIVAPIHRPGVALLATLLIAEVMLLKLTFTSLRKPLKTNAKTIPADMGVSRKQCSRSTDLVKVMKTTMKNRQIINVKE